MNNWSGHIIYKVNAVQNVAQIFGGSRIFLYNKQTINQSINQYSLKHHEDEACDGSPCTSMGEGSRRGALRAYIQLIRYYNSN